MSALRSSRAVSVGLEKAVKEMLRLMKDYRGAM
jgi:pyridoxine 5'-phosphate synthase PdxJ